MGRQSSFRKAGGFLNNEDGLITGYAWTDTFNGRAFEEGINPKTREPFFHSLYLVPSVRQDGATDDVTLHLFAGDFEAVTVSEDGHTITPNENNYRLGDGTAVAKFIQSWEACAKEGAQSEDPQFADESGKVIAINFEPIIGSRVRFVQQPLSAEELASLERRHKPTTRKYKNKLGKTVEAPLTETVIDQVYELAKPAAKSNGKSAAPVTGKAVVAARPTVRSGKAQVAATTTTSPSSEPSNVEVSAALAILRYLEAAPKNRLDKSKLNMRILLDPEFKGNKDLANNVYKFLFNDENLMALAEEGVIGAYDRSKQVIEAVAE